MKTILILFIGGLIAVLGTVIILLYFNINMSNSDFKLENELVVKVDPKAIKQIYSHNIINVSHFLWLHVDHIDDLELEKAEYLGKIVHMSDLSESGIHYILPDQKFRIIKYLGTRPKWWIIGVGYDVYKIETSSGPEVPHFSCRIFVSPDKKNYYIYQCKYTRSGFPTRDYI